MTKRVCSIDGCERTAHARRMCWMHLRRWYTHGDASVRKRAANGELLAFIQNIVLRYEGDECLIWPFSHNGHGYADIRVDGQHMLVSRFVCEAVNGAPPTAVHEAAHNCGDGRNGCISPHHLRWATPTENNGDKVEHGTQRRGEQIHSSKLTAHDVQQIRSLRGTMSQSDIAKEYGVSQSQVSDIQNHKRSWVWL